MFNAILFQKHGVLSRAIGLTQTRGVYNPAMQMLHHSTRALIHSYHLEAHIKSVIGGALDYLKFIDAEKETFKFWSDDVIAASESALSLIQRTVLVQNAFGSLLFNLKEVPGGMPKSFRHIFKHQEFEKWDDKMTDPLKNYWEAVGHSCKLIRDHDQHYSLNVGECWINTQPHPTVEIEFPLDKDGNFVPLFKVARSAFWTLLTTIETTLENLGIEPSTYSVPAPAINMEDARTPKNGLAQLIEIDKDLKLAIAFFHLEGQIGFGQIGGMMSPILHNPEKVQN